MAPSPEAADAWNYCSFLTPLVALAINLVTQVIMVRARKGARFLRSLVEGFITGAVALAVAEVWLLAWRGLSAETLSLSLFVNMPAYAALSYCYFNMANLGQTSIRIRIYSEILAHGGMTAQEIERIYNDNALMTARLERLLESGDLIINGGRYYVGRARLVHVANILATAKHFLLGKKSEFE